LSSAPAEARTDAEGRYRLVDLAVGPQSLTARREGATLGVAQPVSIQEGVTAQVDFTLRETGTLEGVIRAASGPLPSERLLVLANPQGDGNFMFADFRPIEADASGSFRMILPPGTYELRVMGRRQGIGMRESKRVEVEAGKTTRTELILPDERGADSLQGVVLEPDGTPSSGAAVSVSSDSAQRPLWRAPADEQGRFSISMPPEASAGQERLNLTAINGGRIGVVQGVRPGERELTVKLQPSASARGRVVRAGGSAPVKGFTLWVTAQDRGTFMRGERRWEFPADRFELGDILAAPVKLRVLTSDGEGGEALVSPSSGAVSEVEIAVKGMAGVRGRVVDAATKEPVAGVIAFIEEGGPPGPPEGTTPDGRFALERVSPGARTLVIVGGRSRSVERKPVTLVEGQTLDVGDILLGSPPTPPGAP
jgi:hypothetical protein